MQTVSVGTKRFRVEIMDEATVIALAREAGWKDGEGYWDYLDPIENGANQSTSFGTKDAAVAFAHANAARDVYRSPVVTELEMQEEVLGGKRFREWETVERWILDCGELVEAA